MRLTGAHAGRVIGPYCGYVPTAKRPRSWPDTGDSGPEVPSLTAPRHLLLPPIDAPPASLDGGLLAIDPEAEARLSTMWAAQGLDAEVTGSACLTAAAAPDIHSRETRAAQSLLQRAGLAAEAMPDQPDLVPEAELGRGGVGVVYAATQGSLQRTVAVKQALRTDEDTLTALLREAWIAGSLEHPHIVPVYELRGGEGGPRLVMKRVEGVPWARTFESAANIPGDRPADLLDWHLDVLIAVCRAVEFAHSRKILHLDLKPENVMLGQFGEVYLLDWGLALSIDPEAPAWMPQAVELRHVIGTPAYLAPEQAAAKGRLLGPHTDVYLLGATLHHLVAGNPPHPGGAMKALLHAFRAEPLNYPVAAPAELVNICRRAMAREPADRYADAGAFRRAIEAFRRHRAAHRLTAEACASLASLLPRLTARSAGDVEDAALAQAATEVRLRLALALRDWPENHQAIDAMQQLLVALADRHLGRDEVDAARGCLADLRAATRPDTEDPPAVVALAERIERAAEARASEAANIEALRRDIDLKLNSRVRARWGFIIGVIWLAWNVGIGVINRSGLWNVDYATLGLLTAIAMVIWAFGMVRTRHSLARTAVDRRLVAFVGCGLLSSMVLWPSGALLGLPVLHTVGISSTFYVLFGLACGLAIDRRLLFAVTIMLPAAFLGPWKPDFAFECAGIMGSILAFAASVIWRIGDFGARVSDRATPRSGSN